MISNKYKKYFTFVFFFTIIIPNIKVLSSANAFQPLTIFIILIDSFVRKRVYRSAVIFLSVYILCVLATILIHGEVNQVSLLYIFMYMVGPLTLCYAVESNILIPEKLVMFGFTFVFFTTFQQIFINSQLVEQLIGLIFSHRPGEVSTSGIRGAGGFMSEPSHSARLYVFLLFAAFIHKMRYRFLWLMLVIPFLFMNKSASLFIFLLFFLFPLVHRYSKLLSLVTVLSAFLVFPIITGYEFRFSEAIARTIETYENLENFSTVQLLGLAGGRRYIQVAIGYTSLFYYPFGHGIADSFNSFYEVSNSMGFDLSEWYWFVSGVESIKPASYMSQIVYDFGVISILIIFAVVYGFKKYTLSKDPLRRASFLLGLIQVLFYSTTTIPWPWVLIAFGLKLKKL